MVELEVLGWDNGFGQEKGFTVINSKKYKEEPLKAEEKAQGLNRQEKELGIKKFRFPSVHMELTRAGAMSVSFANDFTYDQMDLEFNGKEYLFGNYAIQQDPQGGIKNFNTQKYKEESEMAKLCAGMALMFPEDQKIIIKNLVIGTSISVLSKTVIKEAIDTYKNKTFDFAYPTLIKGGDVRRKNVSLEIQNVDLIPQGIGTVQDLVFDVYGRLRDEHNLLNIRYIIFDIGTNTVDGFIREGFKTHIDGTETALTYGTSDVYKRVASKIALPNKENQIEMLHIKGKESIFYNGKDIDFSQELKDEYTRFANDLYMMAESKWNRYLNTVNIICVSGGCANYIKDNLEKRFNPLKVLVPDDPQFSNARGYYKNGIFRLRGLN